MLRKFINIFNQNQSAKILDFAQVANNDQAIKFFMLADLYKQSTRKQPKQLLTELSKGWMSKHYKLRLKTLIVVHHLVVNQQFYQLAERFKQQCRQMPELTANDDADRWMNTNIVDYYAEYLLKLFQNISLYEQFKSLNIMGASSFKDVNTIVVCFGGINLLNFILKTQISLNKVGRYYPKLKFMSHLFGMYVKDIKVFYHYLQMAIDSILTHYDAFTSQMLRHCFVFITQVQKTLDRLQQFFHNRYFYKDIDVPFPNILQIDPLKYKKLVRYIRLVDKTIDIQRIVPNRPTQKKHKRNKSGLENTVIMTEPRVQTIPNHNFTVFPSVDDQPPEQLFEVYKDQIQ